MNESIKKRIKAVRRGEVPEGYSIERAMLFSNEWGEPTALATVLSESKERNEDLRFGKNDVLSVSGEQGVVNQIDLLGRSYAGESVAPYHVVETGDVVYTKSPLKDKPYGIIKQNRGVPGIVSTLYAVYHCSAPVTGQYLENYFCIDTFLNNYLKPLVKRGAKNDMKVNNEEVLLGRIPLPPIQDQKRINEIIDQCNRVIELKQKLLEEKRRQKQWLMQKLLTPHRGWKKTTIGQIAAVTTGATPDTKHPEYWNGEIRWMNSGELNLKHIYEVEGRITDAGLKKSGTKLIPANCILIGLAGQGKTRGTVAINHVELCTNQSIAAIHPGEQYDSEYLYHYLDSKYLELRKISSGDGTRGGLNIDLIEGFVVHLPNMIEQSRIAAVLTAADNEISLLKQERDMWKQKKKALMQLLLTGLVRVSV